MNFFNREVPSFHAAALILGSAALVSKLLGLFRDRLLAAHFGAGDTLDTYYAAFQIPDVLFTIFLVGAASAAVLPVFLEYHRRSEQDAERLLSNLLTVFSLVSLVLVLGAMFFAPQLMRLAAPGFHGEKFIVAVRLTRIMMINASFLGIAGILSSVLQAHHRFFVFALPPIFYNLGIIAGILLLVPFFGAMGLAYGVVLGGVLQVLIQLPAVFRLGMRLSPHVDLSDKGIRRIAAMAIPRVLALSMSQLTLVALAAIASYFASGSISVFRFASNLLYIPVGLFGVSYALAMFPKLSRATIDGEGARFRDQVGMGLRNILFWTLPFASLFIVLRAHIVRVILGSGAFDWQDTRLVAALLAILAIAIASESILPLVLRAFYALGKTREPLFWDVAGSLITVLFALIFTFWFRVDPSVLQGITRILRVGDLEAPYILGVALAFSLGSIVNVALLLVALTRASHARLQIRVRVDGGAIATFVGAAMLAGIAAYVVLIPFPSVIATNTFLGIFFQGAVAGIAGFAVYGAALFIQKNPELLGVIESFRKHLMSPKKMASDVFEAEKLNSEGMK